MTRRFQPVYVLLVARTAVEAAAGVVVAKCTLLPVVPFPLVSVRFVLSFFRCGFVSVVVDRVNQ